MTKKRHKSKSPLVVPPTPSQVHEMMLDVEVQQAHAPEQAQVPKQDHLVPDRAQVPDEPQVQDQAEVLDQAHVVPDQVQVPAEPQVVVDQPQTVPERAQAVLEQRRSESDRIEMEPKHITFAKEEASNKVDPSADKVMCMAPPTAAGEEPMALQNTGRFSLSLSSGRSVGTTRRKTSKQKPLYKWELPAEEREALEARMRSTHVTTEHGDFRPGEHQGYFHRERDDASIDGSDDRSTASKAVTVLDFQIVLSEAEYRTLQSRRQSLSRRRGLAVGPLPVALTTPGSLCASGGGPGERREGVMASSPYIDPWRVEKAIHRPPHKDNWMSPVGFSC